MHGVTDCLSLSNWWRHCRSNQWHWDDQGWLRFKIGLGRGGGVLIMTQRQSLNQPSLSMLISSILFLMNWLACERTGGNYSNWGEWQEQGRGWGRGEVCCEWAGWMKGGCACVFGGSLSGSFLQDRAITRPGRDTHYVDHSMVLCQRQTTVLWSLYFLHFSEKFGRKR